MILKLKRKENFMTRWKKVTGMVLTLCLAATTVLVNAQDNSDQQQPEQQQTPQLNQGQQQAAKVSDDDLQKFAAVYPKVQQQNQKAQKQMVDVIQKDGMKLDRFNEIQKAKMQGQDVDMKKDEKKSFEKVTKDLNELQPKLQKEIQNVVTSNGLTIKRFQEIASAIQSNNDLQQRFQKMMAAQSPSSQQQSPSPQQK